MTGARAGVHVPDEPAHRRGRRPTYDKRPVAASGPASAAWAGLDACGRRLAATEAPVVAVDAYPGVRTAELAALARAAGASVLLDASTALLPPAAIDALVAGDVGTDPVFGRMTSLTIDRFFDPAAVRSIRDRAARARAAGERTVVYGVGAAHVVPDADVVVVADLARWEAQQRQRAGEPDGLGGSVDGVRPSARYQRSFFVDWRVADAHKMPLLARAAFFLDTTAAGRPVLADGDAVRRALACAAGRPFRVVPFFDPAPWGGHWMEAVCDLPPGRPNHGWCFDCVPEENAVLLAFGDHVLELPALDLVRSHGVEILGAATAERFRGEFPIRFDFLDTVGGGNLSLQVHPTEQYLDEHFGAGSGPGWTQHESYYVLDAEPGASVYLGLREHADVDVLFSELAVSQRDGTPFDADRHVARHPARRHDHFLIPAGTVHCSGAGALVLEISATPFIFTFKLWDWGRAGLDGRPRPIHLDHGRRNLDGSRRGAWVARELVNRTVPIGGGDGWRAERTGLHELEPIETVRHWFRSKVPADADDGVTVLNVVEGEEIVVESPDRAWDPYVVRYAETFVVPAAAGPFRTTPHGDTLTTGAATVRATVRPA